MFTLYCTPRLLRRLGSVGTRESRRTTTRMGDWYATDLASWRVGTVLAVNERTRLPIVLVAKDLPTLREKLASTVGEVLELIAVGARSTKAEGHRMQMFGTAPASNAGMEQLLKDYAAILRSFPDQFKKKPAALLSVHLATTPVRPFDKLLPILAAQRMFGVLKS